MANAEPHFVDFLRGVKHPKLSWVMAQLDILGVNHRVRGKGVSGPILQVEAGQVEKAHAVMITPVGMMNVGGSLTDENILIMDLRDDHPFFESDTDIEELDLPVSMPFKPLGIPASDPVFVPPGTTDEFDVAIGLVKEMVIDPPAEDPFDVPDEAPKADPSKPPRLATTAAPEKSEMLGTVDEDDDDDNGLWDTSEDEAEAEDDPFADETIEEEDGSTTTYADETEDDTHPELDFQRAKDVLKTSEVQWGGVKGPVLMHEVDSANISAIGCRINQTDQTIGTVYGQFKGGAQPYRYGPVKMDNFNHILSEAVRKAEGHPEASVGSSFHHLIKSEADEGNIKCQRLEANGKWVDVPNKAERTKALKDKKKEK